MAGNNDNRYRRWVINRKNKKLGKRPSNIKDKNAFINELNLKAQLQLDRLGKRPSNIKDANALNNALNYDSVQETLALGKRPPNIKDANALNNELNYDSVPLGKRPLNIKDAKDLNNKLNYNELSETLINRSSKILGPKVIPEIPLITGNFLVRENNFIIATENDKLIELDIS